MDPKYVAATSWASAGLPMATDSCSVIAASRLDCRSWLWLKMIGTGSAFRGLIRGEWLFTMVRECGDVFEEFDEPRTP